MTALVLGTQRPTVSVVVPARDEEASLRSCLRSLVSQTAIDFEVIVVDDNSQDRTREIAESFPGVRVIEAPPLPIGWTGKNNAVIAGAQQAGGEWLLFTDADTVHKPNSIALALNEVLRHRAEMISYSPEQEVHGFWEKAIMPVIFAELAATYRPSQVSDPDSAVAAANGQFILISREAYDAIGGHAALATALLEDVELARRVKASDRKLLFRYGADRVRTRMYRSFRQLREGWTKNLALLFRSPVRLSILRMLEFVLIAGAATIALLSCFQKRWAVAFLVMSTCALLVLTFLRRIRRAHFSSSATALSLFGLPLFAYLLVRSRILYKRGTVAWKGRVYGSGGSDRRSTDAAREHSAA